MSEITCSACGAPNPSQSKYCNRCGAPLGNETTQLCPTCDTLNPANLLYCDNCGTRLVDDSSSGEPDSAEDADTQPGSRSQPFSLPARPPGQTGNLDVSGELPDWLVTGDFAQDNFEDVSEEDELQWLPAEQEEDSWDDDAAPTLEELSSDHAPKDDLPTWLMDEDSESTIFGSDKSTDELFMESLESDDAPQEPEAEESEAATNELESWLSEIEEDEAQQDVGESDAPELQPGEEEEAGKTPSPTTEMSEDNFLQWLSEIHDDEADYAGDGPDADHESGEAPAWLSDAVPTLDAEENESDEDDLETLHVPDWLTDETEASAELRAAGSEEEEQPDKRSMVEGDVPEDDFLQWLDSLDEGATEVSSKPDVEEDYEPIEEQQDEREEAGEKQPLDVAQTEGLNLEEDVIEFTTEDFALPDWLGELPESEGDVEQTPVSGPLSEVDELPTWLQNIALPGGDVTLPYVSGSEAELAAKGPGAEQSAETPPESDTDAGLEDTDTPEGELPDWLSGVTPELDSAPPDLTLLDDASQREDIVEEDALASEGSSRQEFDVGAGDELEEQEVSSEDLPDWFSDVLADIETVDELQMTSGSASEMPNVPEQLAGSDLPDWLDSPFHEEEEAAEPTPIEEIPEWLRTPLQEKLARATEERGIDEAALEGGDEWRDLLETPPSSAERTSGGGGRESAVAWLETLRAGTSPDELHELESETDAGEPRSPVSGISGALDATYGVTHTGRRTLKTEKESGKEQEQQILLLRQMARGERVQTTEILPVAAGVGTLPLFVRLTLSAFLLAVVLLGLLASNVVSGLVPQGSGEPAMAPIESVLSDAAGEPVLVVFDYTPAMAGALQPMAADMLQRLQEQNSYTLIASQSAAGLALAAEAAGDPGLQQTGELGLIPGGALGVRQVGRCMRQEAECQTLFGQPVASEDAARLGNASAIVLITGDRDNLVAWVEQLEAIGAMTIGAIVTPALEPVAAPYSLSGQLDGVVVGTGAATLTETPGGSNLATALTLSTWFAILIIIAGAVFYLVSGAVRSIRG